MVLRVVCAVVVVLAVAGCGGSAGGAAPVSTPARTRGVSRAAPAVRPVHHRRGRPQFPDVGRLPQTSALPSAHTVRFRYEMAALWRGVVTGRVEPGMAAFFPETAYAQVKAIPDPAADWQSRLVGGFAADLAAVHALVVSEGGAAGRAGARARLVRVVVPGALAHWVPPGVCYNRIGYWETPNSRVVYRTGRSVRSFGIASMISWRGVWFVVHLGAVVRSGAGGVVDAASAGAGYAAPSSTC